MYCCQCFTNLINSAGESGLAVLVTRLNGNLRFVLQMRAMSYADLDTCETVKTSPKDVAVSLTQSMIIHYCPSCGKSLADLLHANSDEFDLLASEHEPFQDDWGI